MKKIVLLLAMILFMTVGVYAEELDLEGLGLDEIEREGVSVQEIAEELADNGFSWDVKNILKKILSAFMDEADKNAKLMCLVILISVLSAFLTHIPPERSGVNEIAFFAAYIVIASILTEGFSIAVEYADGLIKSLSDFIRIIIPVICSASVVSGSVGSGSTEAIILIATQIATLVITELMFPGVMLSVGVAVVNNLSGRDRLSRLSDIIRKAIKWIMGLLLTLFVSVMTIQCMISPAMNGIAGKTARFAIANFVPAVGGILSDSLNVVVGYSIMLKNIIGGAGFVMTFVICFMPLVQLVALIAIYHITAAVVQPVADARVVRLISEIASSMTSVFIIVTVLILMFIVNLTIAVFAGNISALVTAA